MKRKVLRQMRAGEIGYDPKQDKLVYCDSKQELELEGESDIDSDEF